MEILLYIVKSSALLGLFFLVYEFLLKRDTFFTLNRYFLIAGILVAAALPFLTFTKTLVVEVSMESVATLNLESLDNYSSSSQGMLIENPSFWASIDYTQVLVYLYVLGTIFFLTKLLISLMKLHEILKYRPKTYLNNGIRFIETDRETNPFTFLKTVVYNPNLHQEEELKMILQHEIIHARNWHSIDILLGQLIIAFHWFNPIVWLYSKSIDQNLEFIADYKTTKVQFPKKSYQMTLLRAALPNHLSLPVNNFYSFTKTRILMLNKNKSNYKNRLKVLFVLPFILVFLMSFQIKTVTQIKNTPSSQITNDSISNAEIDLLNSIFKNYNENAVLIFNGKKTTIKEIRPSIYKIEAVRYDEQGIPIIQAEDRGEEDLKLKFKSMPEGIYLQVSEDSNIVLFVKNASNKIDAISVFSSEKGQASKDDGKEQTPKQSGNVSKSIIAKAKSSSAKIDTREDLKIERNKSKDSFRNRNQETQVEVRYEIKKEREKRREELLTERRNHGDSLKESMSKESLNTREKLQQECKLEMENRSDVNKIVSVQVFKDDDYKYAVAVDENNEVVVLRFEVDENTSDASLDKIAVKFAAADVDFEHTVLKRNRTGEISKKNDFKQWERIPVKSQ